MEDVEEPPKKRYNLPAIQRHPAFFKDPYKNSFLLKFNLQKQKEDQLKAIL